MPKTATVFDRAREFEQDGLYVFDAKKSILMCKFCNIRVEWKRRDTCVKHCKDSTKHIANQKKGETNRQCSIAAAVNNAKRIKTDKEAFISSTVQTFLAANIPLHKLDEPHFRTWMNKYINGK